MTKRTLFLMMLLGAWMTAWAGYDLYNGRKTCIDTDYYGRTYTSRECTLKNGMLSGEYKAYRQNGKVEFKIKPQNGKWLIETYNNDGKTLEAQVAIPAMSIEKIENERDYTFYGNGFSSWEEYSMEWDGPQDGTFQDKWTKEIIVRAARIPVFITSEGYWDGCLKLQLSVGGLNVTDYELKQVTIYNDNDPDWHEKTHDYILGKGGVILSYKEFYNNHHDFTLTEKNGIYTYEVYNPADEVDDKLTITMPKGKQLKAPFNSELKGVGYWQYDELMDGEDKQIHNFYTLYGQMPIDVKVSGDEESIQVTMNPHPQNPSYLMQRQIVSQEGGRHRYTLVEQFTDQKVTFKQTDYQGRVTKTGAYTHDGYMVGDYQEYEYDVDSKIISQSTIRFGYYGDALDSIGSAQSKLIRVGDEVYSGIYDGDDIEITTKNGVKTTVKTYYQAGKRTGEYTRKSVVNGVEQLEEYMNYTANGREGMFQIISNDDSLVLCRYHNNKAEGRARIYHDGGMKYRRPAHICVDTTKLTLVYEGMFEHDQQVGTERAYYPCYYTDEQGLRKGAHAGELYLEIDRDNGLYREYSTFGEKYNDDTYTKRLREMHFDPKTEQLFGLATMYDADGQIIQQENYVQDQIHGWAVYRNVKFCKELKAYYTEGHWMESEYLMEDGSRKHLKRVNSNHFSLDLYTPDGKHTEHSIYNTFASAIESLDDGARKFGWIDLLHKDCSGPTGEYQRYDAQERVIEEGKTDGTVLHTDYDQHISYTTTKNSETPILYYVLGTDYLYNGTYNEDLGNNMMAIHTIKKGLRHGTTKIIDTRTKKTIQKIKYAEGLVKP